jgi:hypothetical protein
MPHGRKTTMAKLSREARLRERRLEKKARKDARKRQAAEGPRDGYDTPGSDDMTDGSGTAGGEPASAGDPAAVEQELAPDPSRPDAVAPDSP